MNLGLSDAIALYYEVMESRAAEKMSPEDIRKSLDRLTLLVAHLPVALPIKSPYESCFSCFAANPFHLDTDKMEHTGDEIGALNVLG